MRYNDYEAWAKSIEEAYTSRQAGINANAQTSGLKIWFDSLAEKHVGIQKELERLSSIRGAKQTVPAELDLIMSAIAKAFYPQFYDEEKKIVIKKDANKAKTTFYADQPYGRSLTNYWDGKTLPISIPDVESKAPHYWIEICSALQKEYTIFHSLNDINNFIFAISNHQYGGDQLRSELYNFGLYTRSVQHICVAYAIFHGYSVAQCRELLRTCTEIEQAIEGYPEETRTLTLQKEFEEHVLIKSERGFLDWLKENRRRFLRGNALKHKTAVNEVLKRFGGPSELDVTHDFKNRLERVVELFLEATGLSENAGGSALKAYLSEQINVGAMQALVEKLDAMREQINLTIGSQDEQYLSPDEIEAVRRVLADKNKTHKTKDETVANNVRKIEEARKAKAEKAALEYREEGEEIAAEIINMALRNMVIVYEMARMPRTFDNALTAIDEQINYELLRCGLREISYAEANDSQDGSVLNNTHNLFDWVVVESLIFEEQSYMEKINAGTETSSDCVSGDAFMRYLNE